MAPKPKKSSDYAGRSPDTWDEDDALRRLDGCRLASDRLAVQAIRRLLTHRADLAMLELLAGEASERSHD